MKDFDYRKYLAEGKLLKEAELTDDLVQRVAQAIADEFTAEDRELDLKYVITPNSIEAYPDGGGFDLDVEAGPNTPGDDWEDSRGFGIANYLGDYAGGSFVIRPEGDGHLVTNAASRNAKVAYITPEDEIEIISAEDSKADLGMTDDVETDYMERRKEMSDYMNEAYTPGSGWTKDFDYDGMLNLALKLNADSPMDLLLKVSSDLEDVNYHRENSHLTDAIDAIKSGDRVEAKISINRFRKEVKKNLNENTIKERKTISKNKTKMKKSELKEMIKMALSEDARTDAEQEGYKDGFDDAKDDIEAKLKGMKVSEAEEVDVEDNEEVDVDIEKEVDIDDESVESDIEVKGSMPGEDADEVAVQSLLMKAQEEAAKLGDEKLTDQIGNTITYFTRAHVATVDEAEEMGLGLEENAASNLELKSLAKKLFLGFKKMGADVELTTTKMQLNKAPENGTDDKWGADQKNVWIYVDDNHISVSLVGEKAGGFFDKIQKDFPAFEFKDGGDSKSWNDLNIKNLQIMPGKTTSESTETDYDNTDAVSGDINVTTDNPAADAEIGLALNEEVARFKKLAGIIK